MHSAIYLLNSSQLGLGFKRNVEVATFYAANAEIRDITLMVVATVARGLNIL